MNSSILKFGGVSSGIILSLALLTSCNEEKKQSAGMTLPVVDVEVTPIQHGDVNITQEWIASLRGTEDAEIRAQVSGYLVSKQYVDGSFVNKGDVLFQIDKRPFEAALKQAEGSLAQTQAAHEKNKLDVERYTPLAAKESIGEKQLDDAKQALLETEAAMVSAQAAVDQARINLDFATIKAPISGLAGIAKPSIGNLLSPSSDSLTVVSAIDPIRVDYSISEKDFLNFYGDDKKKISSFDVILSNKEKYPHQGKPVSIDRNVNKDTGTINIVGHIPNPDHLLRPGMYVTVTSVTKVIKNATLVPPRSIMSMQGSNFVIYVTEAGNSDSKTCNTAIFPVIPGPLTEDGRLQVIEPLKGSMPAKMTVVVEGLTQAIMRTDGKGQVNAKPYVDKPSQPVIQPQGKEPNPAEPEESTEEQEG